MSIREGALVLSNGEVFEGELLGAPTDAVASGEVVFHTGLTGYQEVISDPSYAGQMVTFTTPHIGNYGSTPLDDEARKVHARGVIVREFARRRSNWRSDNDLDAYLAAHGIQGIGGIDTRRLTRILRDTGATPGAFGARGVDELLSIARAEVGTSGVDLVAQVTTPKPYDVGSGRFKVVAFDFGIKSTILSCLSEIATVRVVPASTTAEEVLAMAPDGVFLSNGPGDPEVVAGAPQTIRTLVEGGTAVFGICLGHQLLSLALGGKTFKLPFGHHGANHPVRNLRTGRVEITSQNHNFCVDPQSLRDIAEITHTNLNDQTNEGMKVVGHRAFSVQYHPEAGPGPHDSRYLFAQFADLMDGR
ncbi:MAG: glutamine-hydrolyzing carbamoyl-phosphate synthase small subunit [Ilumatobacteraceae bacterium]